MTQRYYDQCVKEKMCFVCRNNLGNSHCEASEDPCNSCLDAWMKNNKDVPGFVEGEKPIFDRVNLLKSGAKMPQGLKYWEDVK